MTNPLTRRMDATPFALGLCRSGHPRITEMRDNLTGVPSNGGTSANNL